ncbi:OmpA family protein [Oceanivirga salmonicida]|uniref:OmpA family protein n=1 Tax=Oceanivirga salmonicida TaxID=1769291 RepID=UPI00082D00F7|nr:OmpA family protein [Oceanivirga salmonicida]
MDMKEKMKWFKRILKNKKNVTLGLIISILISGNTVLAAPGQGLGGEGNTFAGRDSIVLGGTNNSTKGDRSGALGGNRNVANGDNSVILGGSGNKTEANAENTAILGGFNNTAQGIKSVVVGGHENIARGEDSVVIGGGNRNEGNVTEGHNSVIIGGAKNKISIKGENSVLIGGENSTVSGKNSISIGSENKIDQDNVYVIGSKVDATGVKNAIVLGNGSKAETDAISIGSIGNERQIKHVKTGVDNTDAVNVLQLKTLENFVSNNFVKIDGSNINNTKSWAGILSKDANIDIPTDNLVTDRQVKRYVDDKVQRLDAENSKLSGGIATSIAIASVPQVSGNHLVSVGVGGAYYNKTGGFALGLSGTIPSRRIVYKLGAGIDTKKTFAVSAGLNINFVPNKVENSKVVVKEIVKVDEESKNEIENLKNELKELKSLVKKSIKFTVKDFDIDKYNIKEIHENKLKDIVEFLNNNYDKTNIEIIGYTDRTHTEQYNLDLGLKRAISVKDKLIEFGLNKNIDITIKSKGFNEINDGDSSELRRVEVLINNFDIYN